MTLAEQSIPPYGNFAINRHTRDGNISKWGQSQLIIGFWVKPFSNFCLYLSFKISCEVKAVRECVNLAIFLSEYRNLMTIRKRENNSVFCTSHLLKKSGVILYYESNNCSAGIPWIWEEFSIQSDGPLEVEWPSFSYLTFFENCFEIKIDQQRVGNQRFIILSESKILMQHKRIHQILNHPAKLGFF